MDITTLEERPTERQGLTENARTMERLKRKERSVARTTFMLVAIYVICWIPLYVLFEIDASCKCFKLPFLGILLMSLYPLLNLLANNITFLSVMVMPPQLFVVFSLNEAIRLAQQLFYKTKRNFPAFFLANRVNTKPKNKPMCCLVLN